MLEFLGQIGQAAGPIQQIISAIKGPKKPVAQPQPAAEQYSISLLKALADPNNSLVRALADEEFRSMRGAQQGDIRSKVMADRRERSMGRAPVFFDPERADENIAYQISRGTPMLQQQAQQSAIQRILQAAGVGNFSGAESDRWKNHQGALAEYEKTKATAGGVLGRVGQANDALQKILDIFQQGRNQPQKASDIIWDNPNIRWNTPASMVYG